VALTLIQKWSLALKVATPHKRSSTHGSGGWAFERGRPCRSPNDRSSPVPEALPIRGERGFARSIRMVQPKRTTSKPLPSHVLRESTVLVGDWHTHPTIWTGDPTDQASEPDEEAWKHRLETVTSLSSWVGLIFTPGELGWTNPIYHGYLTHQNENGVVVCKQATVTEGRISPGFIG
jgi:hypothetical protein